MQLVPGTRLAAYEIVGLLGAGGMGEKVYRAVDSRLDRHVALKVLPESVATDPERTARFQREARVLASLNHPNIAGLFALEEAGGRHFLTMELVEGETLADRIARALISLDEALPIARQIAEALEAAHEQGIVHRDLKPANIKITPNGVVKVLDFGLAKALVPEFEAAGGNTAQSPTITSPAMMTRAGVLLGTAAYMSPEQAKGRAADRRSDIWAFGCVLYEMLTGKRAFEGDDVSDILANVLKSAPDWSALPSKVPPAIRTVLIRCLERDRARRVADAATVRFVLDESATLVPTESGVASSGSPRRGTARPWLPAFTALVAAALSVLVVWRLPPSVTTPPVVRLTISMADGGAVTFPTGQHAIVISPEGNRVVYVANGRLHLRDLSQFESRLVSVTNAGPGVHTPVFSPDGQSLAFFSSDRTIKRVAVNGGAAVTICSADEVFGMVWDQSGLIFGRGRGGIARCPIGGGRPEQLVSVEDEQEAHGPQMLPSGDAVLFTLAAVGVGRKQWDRDRWDEASVVVQTLSTGERKTLIDGGSDARYISSGHVLYALGGVILSVPFDAGSQRVTGQATPVLEGVRRTVAGTTGAAQFAVSTTGNLVYLSGPTSPATTYEVGIADRTGEVTRLPIPPGPFTHVRVSRDGTRLAVGRDDGKEAGIWIYRLGGAAAMQRLTLEGRNRYPAWAPDNTRVAFQSDRGGDLAIYVQRVDGARAERLTKAHEGEAHVPESWSPDGQHLLVSVENAQIPAGAGRSTTRHPLQAPVRTTRNRLVVRHVHR